MLASDLSLLSANQIAPRSADVNGDGAVAPVDAVLIANAINSHGAAHAASFSTPAANRPFLDVTGNGTIDVEDFDSVVAQLSAAPRQESMLTPSSITLTLDPPGEANEATGFLVRGYVSPPGSYWLGGTLTNLYSDGFPVQTDADGMFTVSAMFEDDGSFPGNGTSSDVEDLDMEVWLEENPSVSATASTTVTIHNVDPVLDVWWDNYDVHGMISEQGPAVIRAGALIWELSVVRKWAV